MFSFIFVKLQLQIINSSKRLSSYKVVAEWILVTVHKYTIQTIVIFSLFSLRIPSSVFPIHWSHIQWLLFFLWKMPLFHFLLQENGTSKHYSTVTMGFPVTLVVLFLSFSASRHHRKELISTQILFFCTFYLCSVNTTACLSRNLGMAYCPHITMLKLWWDSG